jgi:hypothetical protein
LSAATAAPTSPIASPEAAAPVDDLFALARRAVEAREAALGRRGTFTRSRRLLSTNAWRGSRDAVLSYVETADLATLGGWSAAREAGANAVVGDVAGLRGAVENVAGLAAADGARLIARVPFRSGETEAERLSRLRELAAAGLPLWGAIPTPEGEAYGLDTLRFTALCRLHLPASTHVISDVERLGPRLAQMCFGFGADELFAQIVGERALRLGDNANNPALTRKEAVTLIRGAGLVAAERLAGDLLQEDVT